MVKFSKFCFKGLHGDTDPRCCVQMLSSVLTGGNSVKSCVIYGQKNKISAAFKTVATMRIAPKIQHLAHIVPDFIQIGLLSA